MMLGKCGKFCKSYQGNKRLCCTVCRKARHTLLQFAQLHFIYEQEAVSVDSMKLVICIVIVHLSGLCQGKDNTSIHLRYLKICLVFLSAAASFTVTETIVSLSLYPILTISNHILSLLMINKHG